jgi:peptidoglycan/xylan/chitin deacetylase (PgdA/CDA1 family)
MTAATPGPAEVTLTFDNGPEPESRRPCWRRCAAAACAPPSSSSATSWPTRRAGRWPSGAHAEGHWIGNHTFTHSVPLGEQPDDDRTAEAEIGRTQELIGGLAHPDRLFRPFGGGGRLGPHLLGEATLAYLLRHRFTCVLWNAVPGDWRDPDGWVDRALARCRGPSPVALVLHDLPDGRHAPPRPLPRRARGRGCRFRQDFPAACVPIRRGERLAPMDPYVARGPAGRHGTGGAPGGEHAR